MKRIRSNSLISNTIRKIFVLFCLTIVIFSGCGKEEGQEASMETSSEIEKEEVDLLRAEWKLMGEAENAEPMWSVVEYVDNFLPKPEGRTLENCFCASDVSCYYVLTEFYSSHEGEQLREYFLTEYNTDTMNAETISFVLQTSETNTEMESVLKEMESLQANIVGMDVVSGEFTYFVQVHDDSRNTIRLMAIKADKKGNIDRVTDLLPTLTEANFIVPKNQMLSGFFCDREGRVYVSATDMTAVYVLDQNGHFLHKMEAEGQTGEVLFCKGKLPQGIPVYEYEKKQDNLGRMICFDGEKTKVIYSGDCVMTAEKYINQYGEVYFSDGKRLLRWNVNDGSCQVLYDKLDKFSYDAILQNTVGELFLVFRENNEYCMMKLSDVPEKKTVEIEILMTTFGQYVSNCAAEYSRKHPGVTIQVKSPEEKGDLLMNQLMADLSVGKGPGMIVLRREQLLVLQEKGVLAELTGVLPEETVSQIYPGVLQNGMVGDELYGITCEATVSTLLVSDDIWINKTWTLEDVLSLIKKREISGNPLKRFVCMSYDTTASQMLYELALSDMENSPFLNVKDMYCNFESGEFVALLELCKKYGKESAGDTYFSTEEQKQEMTDGRALAYNVEGNLLQFSKNFAMLGDEYKCVGYPTQGESGNYFNFYSGCVAVSATAEHRDIIDDFLGYLLDYETQRQYCYDWVRRDVLQDCVKEQVEIYGERNEKNIEPVFVMGDRSVIPLAGREDGTSYLPEFLELLDSCVSRKTEWDYVRNIVQEEAAAFFIGDKSAQEVARIIQNRIQLYLEEKK